MLGRCGEVTRYPSRSAIHWIRRTEEIMGKRVKIGDVIEIVTERGLAYAQYSLRKEGYGALLRVLPGFHPTRPKEFSEIVNQKERFVTFFPLQAAISKIIFEVVANEELPEHATIFPLFRAAGFIDRAGKVHDWWLWDGERSWQVQTLTDDLRKLPIRSVWNDTLLIKRIADDWTPERET